MSIWRQWLQQPQQVFLRRALFQIHLWTGLIIGLYLVVISLSGSMLVYRNELYRYFSPKPVLVEGSGAALAEEDLKRSALKLYPDYEVTALQTGETANHAIEVTLTRGEVRKRRLLHPRTGEDLGDVLPLGFRFTQWMLDLHDNLLAGPTGRQVNGIGAFLVLILALTGAVLWWPGIRTWKRSLVIDLRSNWKRLNWSLHSMLGFWFLGFIVLWGITGLYLSLTDYFMRFFDYLQPFDETSSDERLVDRIQYWLAYLHFGRLGGRGIPYCGRGLCDNITKAIWAAAALVPPILFATGAIMWWNRIMRRKPAITQSEPTLRR